MLKRLKTVSMMLFLMGASTGAAFAVPANGADDVKITQQSETATGTVVDAMGPVIGASVVVKGTTNGTITDFDGNFSISGVKKGAVLEISFMRWTIKKGKCQRIDAFKLWCLEKTLERVLWTAGRSNQSVLKIS